MADSKADKKKAEELKEDEQKQRQKFTEKNAESFVPNLIATICPEHYAINPVTPADRALLKEVNELKKEGKFWEAASKIKKRDADIGAEYYLSYNSSAEGLEPVYFWILDFLEKDGGKVEKLVDNFVSSPGSGHFSELMGKATRMQEEANKVMQTIGVLIKSVINIVYDLRQFELRLNDYKTAKSKDKDKAAAGLLALKQTWLDNVDIKRGNSSIKAMTFSQQGAFVTLLNAFFMAEDEELKGPDGKEIDLNDIVKRVLKQRILEFNEWKRLSEYELTKRYNMERFWLKSQVDSLKLYARWAKPYLLAAEQLRMGGGLSSSAALIKAFNTNMMQLSILKTSSINVEKNVFNKRLPRGFDKLKLRTYYVCLLVDFRFRGIPQRVDQHYTFGGRSDVFIRAYCLSEEELDELRKRLGESDLNDALKLVEGVTTDSLKEIEKDIRHFVDNVEDREDLMEDKESEKKEDKTKATTEDINPFTALLGKGTFWGKEENKKDDKGKESKDKVYILKGESYAEKVVRKFGLLNSKTDAFGLYDIYKKAHGMGSIPLDQHYKDIAVNEEVGFKDLF